MKKYVYFLADSPEYPNEIYANSPMEVKRLIMESIPDESQILKIIEVKPIIHLLFNLYGIKISFDLSNDCPLDIAIYYYLIKLKDPFILKEFVYNSEKLDFIFNASRLNKKEGTPLYKIFKNNTGVNIIHVVGHGI